MKAKCILISVSALLLLAACVNSHQGSEKQLKENVDSFCQTYFAWQFPEATAFCTDSSRQWLSYAASNVHEEDVEMLRNMNEGTSHEIKELNYDSDSTATVSVIVSNVLVMDTIGKVAHIVDHAQYLIPLKYEKDSWRVNLSSLLRHKAVEAVE